MNKLVPLTKFIPKTKKIPFISSASVVTNSAGVPLGFVFGRETFISLLTQIDQQFEDLVENPQKAYDNWAGRLIDTIEEKLPVKAEFVKDLRNSIAKADKEGWTDIHELVLALKI